MRALQLQEVTQVSGGKVTVTVDVNVPAKYVHVNVVDGTKVITIVNVDWSKFTTKA
jgi:tRNA(Ser,Leu) C12 N-acetylase TAN1